MLNPMDAQSYLNNHFLIAMPGLGDPNFHHTVTYLFQHDETGAIGLVINRPAEIQLGDIFAQLDIPIAAEFDNIIHIGGPVQQDRGFVIHPPEGEWQSSLQVSDQLCVTTSKDILEAIAQGKGPKQNLVALGYAGWGPGQLENEMAQNAWLSGPSDADIIFQTPVEKRWHQAAALLGVDANLISDQAGHA